MANPNWKKGGPSPNVSGRPAVAVEFQARARKLVDELVLKAWEAEVRSMRDDWMKASELLAAYGYGKPSQSLDITAEVTGHIDDSPPLTNDERRKLLAVQLAAEKAK